MQQPNKLINLGTDNIISQIVITWRFAFLGGQNDILVTQRRHDVI